MRRMATKQEILPKQTEPLSQGRSYMLIALLIIGWVAIAWLSADDYYSGLADNLYQRESKRATQQAENIASNIDEDIELLKGIAFMVSRDKDTVTLPVADEKGALI
jgi:hypothetical protein